MLRVFRRTSVVACGLGLIASCAGIGCQNMNHSQNGALAGTGVGALAGSIIGHQTGNSGAGAAIGALSGALAGGVIGHARDMEDQRDAAVGAAIHSERARQQTQQAVTNADVVNLTRNGIDDSLIVSAIQSRGGRFDTSPASIVQLKQSGVSNAVIQTMMNHPSQR